MSLRSELQNKFRDGGVVIKLLLINLGVFVIINAYLLILYLAGQHPPAFLGEHLTLSASSSWQVMLHRPWSLVTYMFAHEDIGHILFNMIALYYMGEIMRRMLGARSVLTTYLLGGFSGYLLFFIAYNTIDRFYFPGGSFILGASAAVMAIVAAAASYAPHMQISLYGTFRVKLMWVAIVLFLLDMISLRRGVNSGGHLSHIGGAIFGYFYGTNLRLGKNIFGWFENFLKRLEDLFTRKRGMRVEVNHARPKTDEDFNLEKKARQERIDFILDKIGKSGYESLSKEEKEFLFRHSQK